jgi:1-acyl-sn-glycerol-3-phosphate acyltransferase
VALDRPSGLIGEISARPGAFFRFAIGLCRVITFVFGLRLELRGAENLPRDARGRPAGGWMAVPVPHRRWIDPFLLLLLLPIEPRLAFFADGRVLFRTRLRRLLFRLLGGMVPVWPRGGAKAFGAHIDAARRVLEAGAVFVIFPEAGPPSPPDRTRPIEPGFGYLAMRTGVPLVPMVIGGTGELYRGRRLILSVLPATTPQELAGRPAGAASPEPGSHEERDDARRIADAFAERVAGPVAELHAEVERASTGDRKRWAWLTHWLDWDADAADAARAARKRGSG